MFISLNSDGTAEMLLPSHVYQGSNIVNVYVIAPFPNTTVLQVGFTLPNGTSTSAPMTYAQDSENNLVVWQYTIAAAITNEAGAASVSITATTTTGQVIASQSIPFTIEETTLPLLPDVPSQDEWTLVLQYIQQNSANIATLQGQISTIEADVATANDNASEALSTAQSAESIAQQAETTANGFEAEIATANQNASAALSTANQAASEVGRYTAQIEQANTNASAAVQTANAAQDTANAAEQSVQDIIDGTTPAGKATADGDGNVIPDTYATNDYVNATFTPRSFFQNLYLSRTGALTANIVTTKPTAAAGNFMTTTTANTTLDFGSATKLTLTRTLQSLLQVTNETAIKITLSFAPSRNAQVEFGARVLVDGTPISSNQAFGLNSYDGNASFTNVAEASFSITLDLITGIQEFNAGQVVTIEIFTRQVNNSSLIIQYFCGVSVSGVERNSFAGITTLTTILDTAQIADNAITTAKIADEAVTEEKLSADVQTTLEQTLQYAPQTLTNEQRQQAQKNMYAVGFISALNPDEALLDNLVRQYYLNNGAEGNPTSGAGWYLSGGSGSQNYGAQLYLDDVDNLMFRSKSVNWRNWQKVLKIDPTTLTPSTDNGWTEGVASSNLASNAVYLMKLQTTGGGNTPIFWFFMGEILGQGATSYYSGGLNAYACYVAQAGNGIFAYANNTELDISTVWYKKMA